MDYAAMTAYATVVGAIGGIIGAIALIGTLMFIARELRDSARATHATAYLGNVTNVIAMLSPIVSSPDVAAFYLRHGRDPSSGTDVDRLRWHCAMQMNFMQFDQLLYQHNLGTLENTLWSRFSLQMDNSLRTPAFREWYKKHEYLLSSELREWVNARIAAMDSKP